MDFDQHTFYLSLPSLKEISFSVKGKSKTYNLWLALWYNFNSNNSSAAAQSWFRITKPWDLRSPQSFFVSSPNPALLLGWEQAAPFLSNFKLLVKTPVNSDFDCIIHDFFQQFHSPVNSKIARRETQADGNLWSRKAPPRKWKQRYGAMTAGETLSNM